MVKKILVALVVALVLGFTGQGFAEEVDFESFEYANEKCRFPIPKGISCLAVLKSMTVSEMVSGINKGSRQEAINFEVFVRLNKSVLPSNPTPDTMLPAHVWYLATDDSHSLNQAASTK